MALRDAFLPSPRRVLFSMGLPATIGDWTIDMLDAGPDDGRHEKEALATQSRGRAGLTSTPRTPRN